MALIAAPSFGTKAPKKFSPTSMTAETFDSQKPEHPLEVTIETVTRLKEMAVRGYNDSLRAGHSVTATYWDGYIRGLENVLEAHNQ